MNRILSGAGALVDRIKINTISREMREGRPRVGQVPPLGRHSRS